MKGERSGGEIGIQRPVKSVKLRARKVASPPISVARIFLEGGTLLEEGGTPDP